MTASRRASGRAGLDFDGAVGGVTGGELAGSAAAPCESARIVPSEATAP
jgi:hypothetical protein